MLNEALVAAEHLDSAMEGPSVLHMSSLNKLDRAWLFEQIGSRRRCYVIEDHMVAGGLGDGVRRTLMSEPLKAPFEVVVLGLEELPACGTPQEVLRHHRWMGLRSQRE